MLPGVLTRMLLVRVIVHSTDRRRYATMLSLTLGWCAAPYEMVRRHGEVRGTYGGTRAFWADLEQSGAEVRSPGARGRMASAARGMTPGCAPGANRSLAVWRTRHNVDAAMTTEECPWTTARNEA